MSCNSEKCEGELSSREMLIPPTSCLQLNIDENSTPQNGFLEEELPTSVVIKVENEEEANHSCNINDPLSDPLDIECGSVTGNCMSGDIKVEKEIETAVEGTIRIKEENEDCPDTFGSLVEDGVELSSEASANEDVELLSQCGNDELQTNSVFNLREVSVLVERVNVKLTESVKVSSDRETPVSSFMCSLCSFTFVKYGDLEEHLKYHFTERRIEKNMQERKGNHSKSSGTPTSEIKKIFPCNTCGKGYTSPYYLKNTHKCSVKRSTNQNLKDDTNSSHDMINVDESLPTTKIYPCPFCGLILSSISNLLTHMSIHTGMRSYCCKVCGKAFARECDLKHHEHNHTRPFVCKICGKNFARIENWKKHYMSHPGVNPFCCPRCGITFSSQINLNRHSVLHKRTMTYPCISCDQTFSSGAIRNKHYGIAHPDEYFFPCVFCGKNFFSPSDLHRHVESTHDNDQVFRCYLCEASFLEFNFLRKHFGVAHKEMKCPFPESNVETSLSADVTPENLTNQKTTFDCKVCGKELSSIYSLKTHITRHKQMESFSCYFCEKMFSSYRALIAHVSRFHKNKKHYPGNVGSTWNSSMSFFKAKRVLHKAIRSLDYSVKRRKLLSSDELSGHHLDIHRAEVNLPAKETGSSMDSSELNLFVNKTEGSVNSCEENFENGTLGNAEAGGDSAMTHASPQLQEEQSQVTKESFPCDVCRKSFSSLGFYKVHRKLHSKSLTSRTKFNALIQSRNCMKDGRKLSNQLYNKRLCLTDNVDMDMQAGINMHVCLTCGKMFKRSSNLKLHERIHTGETPYCCSVCGKRFPYQLHLLRHMLRQHGKNSLVVAGKNLFTCERCGKVFVCRYHLVRHEQTHIRTYHSCQTCGKTFMHRSYLVRHERLHSGENTCKVCGKTYSIIKRLKLHMETHERETPVVCKVDGKESSLPSSLDQPSLLEDKKSFSCVLCESTYRNYYTLRLHIRKKHKHGKSCLCEVCIVAHPLQAGVTSTSVEKSESTFENDTQKKFGMEEAGSHSRKSPVSQPTLEEQNKETGGPFHCDVCGKSFSMFGYFKVHRRIHSSSLPTSMKYSALSRSRNVMISRKEASGEASRKSSSPLNGLKENKSNQCEKCGRSFLRNSHLRDHEKVHTGVTPYSCSTCGAAFRTSKSFKMHTKQHCKDCLSSKKELSSTVLDQQSLPQDQKSFSCILCASNYLSGSALKKHIMRAHEHARSCRCQVCMAAYVSPATPTPLHIEPEDSAPKERSSKLSNRGRRELFSCNVCPQTFSSSSSLEEHITLSHKTPKPLRKGPGLPPGSSKRNGGLQIEESLPSDMHATDLPSTPVAMKKLTLRCDLCSETFESGNSLSQHYKSSHNRTKTFHCGMCGKGFGSFEYYSVHLRLHMGERPFCCEVCGGSFSSKSNLSAHKVRVHSSVEKKPFVCAVCGEAFSEKSDFKEHCMENHSDIFLA